MHRDQMIFRIVAFVEVVNAMRSLQNQNVQSCIEYKRHLHKSWKSRFQICERHRVTCAAGATCVMLENSVRKYHNTNPKGYKLQWLGWTAWAICKIAKIPPTSAQNLLIRISNFGTTRLLPPCFGGVRNKGGNNLAIRVDGHDRSRYMRFHDFPKISVKN